LVHQSQDALRRQARSQDGHCDGVRASSDSRRHAGTHHAVVDKNGIAWISENWAHQLNRLDPQTGQVTQFRIEGPAPINAGGFGNFDVSPDGFVWDNRAGRVRKISTETGKVVQEFRCK